MADVLADLRTFTPPAVIVPIALISLSDSDVLSDAAVELESETSVTYFAST